MRKRGYLASYAGAFAGAVVGGGLLGFTASRIPCDTSTLECLGVAIISFTAALIGAAVGSSLGCWIALRIRRAPRAGATGWLLFASWMVLWGMILLVVNHDIHVPGGTGGAVAVHLALPLVARRTSIARLGDVGTSQHVTC